MMGSSGGGALLFHILSFFVIYAWFPYVEGRPGLTPVMGWSPAEGNRHGCTVNETTVLGVAEELVGSSGLGQLGFRNIVLDSCWIGERDANGTLHSDGALFPSGMASLSKELSAKGLSLGLTVGLGHETCDGRAGSKGFEVQDASLLTKDYGAEFVLADACHDGIVLEPKGVFSPFSQALNATGKAVVFAVNTLGEYEPWVWAPALANSWRTTRGAAFDWKSVASAAQAESKLFPYAHPGAFNDPGPLPAGVAGLSRNAQRASLTMWSLLKAPLILSAASLTAARDLIVSGKSLLAVNQDPMGNAAAYISDISGLGLWGGPLADGSVVAAVLSRSETTSGQAFIRFFEDLNIDCGSAPLGCNIVDLWSGDVSSGNSWNVTVPPEGAAAIVITPPWAN